MPHPTWKFAEGILSEILISLLVQMTVAVELCRVSSGDVAPPMNS